LQTDGWRLHELEKSLTNSSHPYSKFGTGNLRTLKYNPEKLGLNIREELLRFHDTYYSSNIMKLCVLGKGKKSNYKWTDRRRVWREYRQN
jgi:insulysin